MAEKSKNIFKSLWSFVEANTSGVPFVLWAIAGGSSALTIFALKDDLRIDMAKLYPVLGIAFVWFIASDVIKKRRTADNALHFLFDSIFYTIFFSFLVFHLKGYTNGLFFIGTIPIISAPLFADAAAGITFAFVYSIIFFFAGHLQSGIYNLTRPDIGLLALQTVFCVIVVAMIKFFLINLEKANGEKLSFAQKEVDEKTKELRKTFDNLRDKDDKLKEQLEELEKFQEIAVGRELRMIELKRQLSEMDKKLKNEKDIN